MRLRQRTIKSYHSLWQGGIPFRGCGLERRWDIGIWE